MSDIDALKNFLDNSCEKKYKISKSGKLIKDELKRPQTPFFLFCSSQRKRIIQNGKGINLTAKELGEIWKNLPEEKKQIYKDKYKSDKLKYERLKAKLKTKNYPIIKRVNNIIPKKKIIRKVKAIPEKISIDQNNYKACNCGICLDCKKRKDKNKEDELKEEEINKKNNTSLFNEYERNSKCQIKKENEYIYKNGNISNNNLKNVHKFISKTP